MHHFNPCKHLPFAEHSNTSPASSFIPLTGLETVVQQLAGIKRGGLPSETAAARIEFLQKSFARLQDYPEHSQEVRASLQYELALANLEYLGADRTQQIEIALVACGEALRVYTFAEYPDHYASTQTTLGNIYQKRALGAQRDNLEQAIACYQEALRVYTLSDFPYEYAQAQHGLGQTYQLRIEGARQDNLEQAIACCREALGVRTVEVFPFEYASTLHTLGAVSILRVAGERRDNLEQAIEYFRQATSM